MARSKDKESYQQIADRLTDEMGWPVTKRMAQMWVKAGYNVNDHVELDRQLRNQERLPKGMPPRKSTSPDQPPPPGDGEGLSEAGVESQLRQMYERLLSVSDYEEARTLRTQMQGIKDILKELREQGRYILKEDAGKSGAQAALSVRGELEKLEDSLPPILEGLTALQMKSKLRDYSRGIMLDLSRCFDV